MFQLNPTDGVDRLGEVADQLASQAAARVAAQVADQVAAQIAEVNRESAGVAPVAVLRPAGMRSRPLHRLARRSVPTGTPDVPNAQPAALATVATLHRPKVEPTVAALVDVMVDELVDELRVAAGAESCAPVQPSVTTDAASRRFVERVAGLGSDVSSMHGRRVPHSIARIPHLVVGASAVFVVHVEQAKRAKVRAGRTGRFGTARDRLLVAGQDRTAAVEAVRWQVAQVRSALADADALAGVPVRGVLCLVDADFPVRAIELHGVQARGLSSTVAELAAAGPLDEPMRERLAAHLARYLPPRLGR